MVTTPTRSFISKSMKKHPNRFFYHNTNYIGLRYNVDLYCIKHKLNFTAKAEKHLKSDCGGCPRCAASLVLGT